MARHVIQRYEHEKLLITDPDVDDQLVESLEKYYGTSGTPYFSLIHRGVKFNSFVGVIQVGYTLIEVLPKVDRLGGEQEQWRNALIQMLRITMGIEAQATSESTLKIKHNSILDLYTELFVKECEYITHKGLEKKYIRNGENRYALKGRLNMSQHIQKNIIHKERFHVTYDNYQKDHTINQILGKTLKVLSKITKDGWLIDRIRNQELYFLDISDFSPTIKHFDRVQLNRKTIHYKKALNIAKMILLNYHPDISAGREDVLALMFDMNVLWEKFITQVLRKSFSDRYHITAQSTKLFWESENRNRKRLKPDIIMKGIHDYDSIVIDTKWKLPPNLIPSDEDLKQIFSYNMLYNFQKGILLYPGPEFTLSGMFKVDGGGECKAISVSIFEDRTRLITNIDHIFSS